MNCFLQRITFVLLISVSGLHGCTNDRPGLEPGTMRIWLSPANRNNVRVDDTGYVYVKVAN